MRPFPINFKQGNVIPLQPGEEMSLEKPLLMQGMKGVQFICPDSARPTIIRCKYKEAWEAITFGKGCVDCGIKNVVIDTIGNMRGVAIYDGAKNITVDNVTGTAAGGAVVILRDAVDAVIQNFAQKIVTKSGYFYANGSTGIIRNGSTAGNLYENEVRAHASRLALSNLKIFGLCDENDATGNKDNSLRLHDCSDSIVVDSIFTGNVRLGVMGDLDGGLIQYRRSLDKSLGSAERARWAKEHERMMKLTAANITLKGVTIIGFPRLESGLVNVTFDDCTILYPGSGTVLRNDGSYAAGGLSRPAPSGIFKNCDIAALAIPGKVKAGWKNPQDAVDSCLDYHNRGKFDKASICIGDRRGFKFSKTEFNGKAFK